MSEKVSELESWSRLVETREQAHEAAKIAYRAAWQMVDNGTRCMMIVREFEDAISVRQRGFFHAAVLPQIAEQVVVGGSRFATKVWKEHLKDILLPDVWEMRHALVFDRKTKTLRKAKRATPHKRPKSTEDLGVKRYSEFIDCCIAHASTEWGVEFLFFAEEREAVRYTPPKRKAKQEEAEHVAA